LKDILNAKKFDSIRFDVLSNLTQISPFIPQLNTYIDELATKPIVFDNEEFAPFIMEIIPAIRLLDLDILLPKSLEGILKPKATVQIKKNEKNTGFFGLNDLFSFNWQVALGDTVINLDEFKKLLKTSQRLIKYKSKYIYVEEGELQKLFNFFANEKQMSSFELLRTAFAGEYQGNPITLTDEAQTIIDELTKQEEIDLPKNINASLRPYQKRGYSWMYRNSKIGFGSVLADDMGLGKTLQVITTILKFKEEGALEEEKVLVVAPTGLLSNWESEIKKFAPSLKTKIHHGTQRQIDKKEHFDVLISSYGIVRSDSQLLKKNNWQTLIIDEAQNIKNSNTNQAKAIKSIPAKNFIAMSGTPVENRLSEMWSIMDFSNRGFLGSLKEFNQQFAIPIEQQNDEKVAKLLKQTTSPFLMRRLKSDKTIISDLPDKVEMDALATLTKEQASLYEETLQKAMKDIEGIVENDAKAMFVKRALVLQMMLALKQICNHPTNYLKNKVLVPELSGKMQLLFDLLDAIVDSGEKVLIFTQYREMGDLLQHFIHQRFGEEPMFYHGGCSIKERNEMLNRFQTNPADQIFILSLKAAGTGLNLTAANHVVHYDLWWNPAVEAQATDRAYRIGQTKNVMVHRFITQNTFEEKINEMIQHKKHLAELTVATGENWIGDLSNKELREIFELAKP
jgi:SNF2 family DNA or RNA helicase